MAVRPGVPPNAVNDGPRRTVGILVSSDCTRLSAALVAARGHGFQLQAEVGEGLIVQVPKETTALWRQLTESVGQAAGLAQKPVGRVSNPSHGGEPAIQADGQEALAAIGGLRSQMADVAASVVHTLLAEAAMAPDRILAIGVHEPGLWSCGAAARPRYLSLCDAAWLAEETGMNVIDAFPGRDLATGGQGGPVTALPEWVLLGHSKRSRALLDLGRTTRLTYLGAGASERGPSRLYSLEVGPGMRLIDLLAQRLTNGEHAFDPGGRLAVQGQRLAPLAEHWLADPYFRRSAPRWHPRGVRPERFLFDALRMAVDAGWSVRDILCTATHFVAETVAQCVARDLPDNATVDDLVIAGGGQHNGMLLRELTALFPRSPMLRTAELGIDSAALGPASAAILALLHIDQVPAGLPEVTGAEVGRVLGCLTPGSPQSWQRLLGTIHGSRPTLRPLRSAI